MAIDVSAIARGLGQFYVDGVELMEIHVDKAKSNSMPFELGRRVEVSLVVGGRFFVGGMRATPRNRYVWICSDLRDESGSRARLADVLADAGIHKNQRLNLLVNGKEVKVDQCESRPSGQIFPEEIEPDKAFYEGATAFVRVTRYERDAQARAACIAHYGCQCSVCGFDFALKYGDIGVGFIHVHHLVPLSMISAEYVVDPVKDLATVCPNCHAMLHQRSPPFDLEELRKLIARRQ